MLTGDNLLTGFAVCKELGLLDSEKTMIIGGEQNSATIKCSAIGSFEILHLTPNQICQYANANRKYFICEGNSIDKLKFSPQIVNACTLFARTSPQQKGEIVKALRLSGKKPLMVGDGTNDMLAMREAAAGISLAAKISPSLLQKQAKNSFEQPLAKQTTLKKGKSSSHKNQNPETSLLNEDNRRFSFIRKFIDRIIEKFNSVDENEIVQPSTIASSFSTSDVNPIIGI